MKYTLLLALFLTGCATQGVMKSNDVVAPEPAKWKEAPMNYTCTAKQNKKVETETLFCSKNTSLSSAYCYSSAITRNCSVINNK
jgi:hypothetical protein